MPVRAWRRENATEGFRRSGAPIPLTRGFQVARNRVSPCKAHLHGTDSHWLVGGRRPSVLQRWGLGFQTASGSAQGAAGTVAARSFWRTGIYSASGVSPSIPRRALLPWNIAMIRRWMSPFVDQSLGQKCRIRLGIVVSLPDFMRV